MLSKLCVLSVNVVAYIHWALCARQQCSFTHARALARARTHARTHTHAHTRTLTHMASIQCTEAMSKEANPATLDSNTGETEGGDSWLEMWRTQHTQWFFSACLLGGPFHVCLTRHTKPLSAHTDMDFPGNPEISWVNGARQFEHRT